MPVPIEAYIEPRFIRYRERYPMSYNKSDRFLNTIAQGHSVERYNGDIDARNGWKQAGYNANSNSTRVERINVRSDDISLKPY